ncbi:MAG: hypothetical protein H6Q59_2624 [Firmicutes bacterium]|nr:hypothetical protein [Bacillota bacterium]
MLKFLYEENIIMYAFAALGGLGLLVRVVVDLVYRHLVRESENPAETKNKLLKLMKLRFEACYKAKIGVNNVDTFVDKSVLKYRFCGVLLSTWDNFSGQILFLTLLMVPISAVFGVAFDCGQDVVMLTGAVGILTSAVLILVDKSINLPAKKKMLRLNLLDYLENFCKVRLEQEVFHPEMYEQIRKEFAQVAEAKKQVVTSKEEVKEDAKEELNRRREIRKQKEEERKLEVKKREEEQRRLEEVRKEEERRRQEERRQLAARRREEELKKIEEERLALEARREELKKQSLEKHLNIQKKEATKEKEVILHSLEEELKPTLVKTDLNAVMQGLDEIAAGMEKTLQKKDLLEKEEKEAVVQETVKNVKPQNKSRAHLANVQEDKLIEDVLKEFFA